MNVPPTQRQSVPTPPLQPLDPRAVCLQFTFTNIIRNADYPPSSDAFLFLDLGAPGCERLIRRAFASDELFSLLEAIFSSKDEVDKIRCLRGEEAQAFVNVMYEALGRLDLSMWTRKPCVKSLYRTCGRCALLPKALIIPVCYDRSGVPIYSGGFGDVWKGKHRGQDVAVKVLKTYSNSDLQRITRVSYSLSKCLYIDSALYRSFARRL
jgi:hypothetical protein